MPIQGAFGYEISNKGQVKGKRGKLLKQYTKIHKNYGFKYHRPCVRIQKRIISIRELIDANKPSSILTGVIWTG